MPWKEWTTVSQRQEFVRLASQPDANVAALCRSFRISRKTGYKWLARAGQASAEAGAAVAEAEALADRSRRPGRSPTRSDPAIERAVIELRRAKPAWGGRKLARRLKDLGYGSVPSPSTITSILHRHDLIDPASSEARQPPQRFEHARPNDLWQMDFKGDFPLHVGGRCYPLTVTDDHSRYNLVLQACTDQRTRTVKTHLTAAFERYGLPRRMLMDNGSPWGAASYQQQWTPLTVWLLRLGVSVSNGRPYHPQTQGKEERFHRTLDAEVLCWHDYWDASHVQKTLDPWQVIYNFERPHDALHMATPGQWYEPSPRPMPATLPAIEYADREVRKVGAEGQFSFAGRTARVCKAFRGQPVALRPTSQDGVWDVYFCHQRIGQLDEATGRVTPPPKPATAHSQPATDRPHPASAE